MNANIINTQIFHLIKYDHKGHWRSQNFLFMLKHAFLLNIFLCIKSDFIKTLYERRCKFLIRWSLTSKVIEGHTIEVTFIFIISLFLCTNDINVKTQILHNIKRHKKSICSIICFLFKIWSIQNFLISIKFYNLD